MLYWYVFLSHWFVHFPLVNSVMPSVTLDQNTFSLSVLSLFPLVLSLSIFMGLLVGVLEALPLLCFPACGGSETEMEKETVRRREKKRIKEDRERWWWWWWWSQRRTGAQGACRRTSGCAVSLYSVWCMDFSSINEICLILSRKTSQRIRFLCLDDCSAWLGFEIGTHSGGSGQQWGKISVLAATVRPRARGLIHTAPCVGISRGRFHCS